VGTLVDALAMQKCRYGLAAIAGGAGMGIAAIIECLS